MLVRLVGRSGCEWREKGRQAEEIDPIELWHIF